ncbi:MAG: D-amino acid dehydrogenase [Alphaproteobacteria bacterium]|nr:D-amino acid dehydrogenase [Alphaproteobacteria bacterium]
MKVLILGAGVAGVSAAWYLLRDGHEVSVVDRQPGPALETSYANAGLIAPGHSFAWASPKAPRTLMKSLWRDDQAFRFRLTPDPRMWAWSLRFLRECTAARARTNTLRKHALCLYSQQLFRDLIAETGIEYDGRTGGLLYLYRTPASFERGVANMRILAEDGQEQEIVDPDRIAEIDPSLAAARDRVAGGIYCPTDESGDAWLFTAGLARLCAGQGADLHYGRTVQALEADGDRIVRISTDRGDMAADIYVLAFGCYSSHQVRPLGVSLPVYPVKGYSVTVPLGAGGKAPAIGGVDEDNLVAYCPMGRRLRVTATAEFAGYSTRHRPADFRKMLQAIQDLFPEGGDFGRPEYWAGLRPMTPEGTPILGFGKHRNLCYNTGHGHMGWTMACGTAAVVADLIAGRTPDLALDGMKPR